VLHQRKSLGNPAPGKLWDSLSELHSSLRERGLVCTVLRPALLLPVRTAQFTQIFCQV
jgi:hypothetical protein